MKGLVSRPAQIRRTGKQILTLDRRNPKAKGTDAKTRGEVWICL